MKEFKKNCPSCNKTMQYSRKDALIESLNKNRKCKKCAKKGTVPSIIVNGTIDKKYLDKISKNWFKKGQRPANADFRKNKTYEEIYGIEKAKKIKKQFKKRKQPKEANKKRSEHMKKMWSDGTRKGCPCKESTKDIHRMNMIKRLKKTNKNFHPPYNKKACKYFEKLMLETNTHIQHALNGGEVYLEAIGFWIDGYDEKNNIVYEFDEKRHFDKNGNLNKKDIIRQKKIIDFLKCKFVRIKYDNSIQIF